MIILIVKYICMIIALFSTLMFISDMVVSILQSSPTSFGFSEDLPMKHAALRLIFAIIMSFTWPAVFLL